MTKSSNFSCLHAFLAFLLVSCNQLEGKVGQLVFDKGEAPGKLSGVVDFPKKSLFIDESESIQDFVFKEMNIKSASIEMFYTAPLVNGFETLTNMLSFKSKAKLKKGGIVFEKGEVEVDGQKLKNVDCDNVFDFNYNQTQSIAFVSTRRFYNLSSCQGDGLVQFSPNFIGKRELPGKNWYDLDADKQMGWEFTRDYLAENKDKIISANHPASLYLQEVMERIASVSDMPEIEPKVYLINADVKNAFALPGGYVFVFRGLLESSPTEASLVGVLGHEWGHVTSRHGTENMTRAKKVLVTSVLAGLALSVGGEIEDNDVLRIAGPLVAGLGIGSGYLHILNKGRDAELEADSLGAQYAWSIGYDPIGLSQLFAEFKKNQSASASALEKLLSTHPDHDLRIKKINSYAKLFFPKRTNLVFSTDQYMTVLDSLKGLPIIREIESVNLANKFVQSVDAMVKSQLLKSVVREVRGR